VTHDDALARMASRHVSLVNGNLVGSETGVLAADASS
jgi:predicted ABC-type transport system involved in lysophospholipase L1 biosynthesis ATPase subunit